MRTSIYPISLGVTRTYIVANEGVIMIDAGPPGQEALFKYRLGWLPVKPGEVKLVVLTHGHSDHVGSASEIQAFTGAKLALHQLEKDWLETAHHPFPPGVTFWGRLLSSLGGANRAKVTYPPAKVDLDLGDEGLSLEEYGIPGRVIHTPGHTLGSVSVLLETGEAFVGDLAMSTFPLRLGPGLPIFAEDIQKVKESWRRLLNLGAKIIFPAHGKSFSAEVFERALAKMD